MNWQLFGVNVSEFQVEITHVSEKVSFKSGAILKGIFSVDF